MAISNDQKIDYLWKKLGYGRTKTDVSTIKDAVNESISSPLLIRGDNVWSQSNLIPGTIPGSSTSVVTLYPTSLPVECIADITSSTNRTWKTNITDWIPPEIGSTYLVKVYVHTSGNAATAASSGTQLIAAGSGNNDEWFFDYQSGTLNFIGTNLPSGVNFSGKSIYISGAVYSGVKGVAVAGAASSFSSIYVSGIGTVTTLDSTTGAVTNLSGTNINYTGIGTITTLNGTTANLTNISGTNINYNGIGTIATLNSTTGTVTNLSGTSANYSGIITASSFHPSSGYIQAADGTNSFYIYSGTGNVAFQGTIGVGTINNTSGHKALDFGSTTTPSVNITNSLNVGSGVSVVGVVTASSFSGTATSTTNIPNLTGDVTSDNTVTTLATVNNNVGTFGSQTSIPSITVNAKGLVTGVTTSSIIVGDGTLTLQTSGIGLSGSQTFTANQSNNTTFTVTSNATSDNTSSSIVARDSSGNFNAGIITATTFSGSLQGNASTATALQNSRTFEITGDIVASAISFDGTGNVSLAATIQPNSVGLGTDTTGDYVQTISGTANQITVTSGTGESSSPVLSIPNQFTAPQDVTVTRDLFVNRDLSVTGNITIGGTSAAIFSQSLNVFDPDIVLGFRTDALGNDVSNDNTANHGGVAVASTEGTPLVQLFIAGIETNPATYKKIMWFKAGEFAGLGTDAWLINYAVGIGSTQFPYGTRLAAGAVQFTESDLAVVRNINASGISTIITLNSTTGTVTNLSGTDINYSGVGTIVTLNSTNGTVTNLNGTNINYSGIGTIATLNSTTGTVTDLSGTDINYSGVGTVVNLNGTNINYTGVGTIATLNSTTGAVTNLSGTDINYSGIGTITTLNSTTGTVTNLSGTNVNYNGIGTIATLNSTTGAVTNLSGTNVNYTGIGTIATLNSTTGTVTNLNGTNINYSGIGTIATLNSTTGTVTNLSGTNVNYNGIGTITNLGGINANYAGIGTIATLNSTTGTVTNLSGTNIDYTGIGTITNLGGIDINYTGIGTIATLNSTTGSVTTLIGTDINYSGIGTVTNLNGTNINYTGIGTVVTLNSTAGTVTNLNGTNINYSGIGTIATFNSTNSTIDNLNSTNINVSGLSTFAGITTVAGPTLFTKQLSVSGVSTFHGDVKITDGKSVYFGDGNDLRIYHDGGNSFIRDIGVGNLFIDASNTYHRASSHLFYDDTGNKTLATFTADGSISLYYDNLKVFETSGIGATVYGTLNTQDLNVTGVGTVTTLNSTTGFITTLTGTDINYTGISTFTTLNSTEGTVTNLSGTDINYSGIGTVTNLNGTNINYTGIGTVVTLNSTTGTVTNLNGTDINYSGVGTIATLNSTTGTVTNLNGTDINYSGVGTIATLNSTTGTVTNLNGTNVNYNGIGTVATLSGTNIDYSVGNLSTLNATTGNIVTGVVTTLTGTNINYSGIGTIVTLNSTTGTVTNLSGSNINYSGIITASEFTTGNGNLGFTTNTISGPSEIIIDPLPVGVGVTSGSVRIRGDLYVDGTNFIVNSQTITLADFVVGIATTVPNNNLLDGAGIGIGSEVTFLYDYTNSSLKSSENLNLAANKSYKINGVDLLNSNQLTVPNINSSGVGTITTLNSTTGTVTNLSGTNINYTGIGTIVNIDSTTGTFHNLVGAALSISGISTISVNSSSNALRITQTGSGNALVVEDETNPDATPFVVTSTGSVGIAITNPSSKLHVIGDAIVTGILTATDGIQGIGIQSGGVTITTGILTAFNFVGAGNTFAYNPATKTIDINIDGGQWTYSDTSNIETSNIYRLNGNIGVGTAIPTSKLHIIGDTFISGVITSTDYNSASDINLKENVKLIENPVDKVLQLNGVTFDWKENKKSSMGVIAQDVEKVIPELVSNGSIKTVNYNGLIGLLIEVVKEQQNEINILKNRLNSLDA